jgi:hypothetical protein
VKFKERVVIGTQGNWMLGRSGEYSIQHAAYSRSIKNPGVNRETDQPPRILVHEHHDPVSAQEQ